MKRYLPLLLAGLLAGCMAPPPAPPAPYHAVGTEPFWNLIIDDIHVTFTAPDQQPIIQPRPAAVTGVAGETYTTPRIRVNIVHAQCSDGMSDRVYPDRVQVDVDGRRFNGCGGL